MTPYRGIATIACLALGVLCPGLHAVAQADPLVANSTTISAFQTAHRAVLAESPDQSLWSSSRRTGYRESLAAGLDASDGLLHIPAIDLSVPIFGGTTEVVLNRGIGWIESTARPGAGGNVGLAGHRDGFFRRLKDLMIGDAIELQTADGTQRYRVTEFLIVAPTDVSVIEPTLEPTVTLVTCYPFYFVGHAPQRYIVRGVID
jgi:sortase A